MKTWSSDDLGVKIQMSFFQENCSLEVMILEDELFYPTTLHSVTLHLIHNNSKLIFIVCSVGHSFPKVNDQNYL